jgi:hypothetical protein
VLAIGVATSRVAHAQAVDPGAAVDLFHQGRAAMAAGSYDVACAKFAESERFDPRVGTLINSALCEEARRGLSTARRYWEQATDLARATGDARIAYTTEHFDAIDRRVPRLTIRLAANAPADAVVHRDDVALGAASLGTALPVDPGAHAIVAVASHHADGAIVDVTLAEGESKEIVVGPGDPIPEAAAPDPEPASPPTASPATTPEPKRALGPWRIAAIATGSAGVIGLGLGTYFGVRALDGKNGSPGTCTGDVCDTAGSAARRDAIRSADTSTVAFIAGGALVAAGVVLWLAAPAESHAPASVGVVPGVGGASLVGRF